MAGHVKQICPYAPAENKDNAWWDEKGCCPSNLRKVLVDFAAAQQPEGNRSAVTITTDEYYESLFAGNEERNRNVGEREARGSDKLSLTVWEIHFDAIATTKSTADCYQFRLQDILGKEWNLKTALI